MKLKGKVVNFLGDSITRGSGTTDLKFNYVNTFKELTKIKKANNYGIGGTRIAKKANCQEEYDYQDFLSRYPGMDKNADIIVVFGGTNDFGHGDAKIGTFESRDPYTFYGACHLLMSGLCEMYIGKPIVILTPIHRTDEFNKKLGHTLKDYVEVIKEVAEYYSLPVLDLYKMSGISVHTQKAQQELLPDGLHPSDKGHRIIAERLKGFLEAL